MALALRNHNCMTARTCVARFVPASAEERTARRDSHGGAEEQLYVSIGHVRARTREAQVALLHGHGAPWCLGHGYRDTPASRERFPCKLPPSLANTILNRNQPSQFVLWRCFHGHDDLDPVNPPCDAASRFVDTGLFISCRQGPSQQGPWASNILVNS